MMTEQANPGANGTPNQSPSVSEEAVEAGARVLDSEGMRPHTDLAGSIYWQDRRTLAMNESRACLTAALTIERERWEADAVARIEKKRAANRSWLASYNYALDVAISALRMSDTKEVSKDQCPDCEGDGSAYQQITAGDQTAEEYAGSCPTCNGTGSGVPAQNGSKAA